jgi:hypothetical protein
MPDFPQDATPGELFYPAEGSSRNPVLYTFNGREWQRIDARTALIYWLRREGRPELTVAEYDEAAQAADDASQES